MKSFFAIPAMVLAGSALLGQEVQAQQLPDLSISAIAASGQGGICVQKKVRVMIVNSQQVGVNESISVRLQGTQTNGPSFSRYERLSRIGPNENSGRAVWFHDLQIQADGGQINMVATVNPRLLISETRDDNQTKTHRVNCVTSPPKDPINGNKKCDLVAEFTYPQDNVLVGGKPSYWKVLFSNKGKGACPAHKVKLSRYSGTTASGYGTQIGGSGSLQTLPSLNPGAKKSLAWDDKNSPKSGKFTYKIRYSSPANDSNNRNHHPEMTVLFKR